MNILIFVSLFVICVQSSILKTGRILGGDEANKHAFPYMVGLEITTQKEIFLCGGSLITSNYVLTAAQCTDKANKITIVLGGHVLPGNEAGKMRLKVGPHSVRTHEDYNESLQINDIAVVKLPFPVRESNTIRLVELATDDRKNFLYEDAILSGWGKTADEDTPSTLKYTWSTIISNNECQRHMGRPILAQQLCASGNSPCKGDFGGPLTIYKNGNTVQIGIASFTFHGVCRMDKPHGYLRITKYINWIRKHTDLDY